MDHFALVIVKIIKNLQILCDKTSRWISSARSGSWCAAKLANYCPDGWMELSQQEVFSIQNYHPVSS